MPPKEVFWVKTAQRNSLASMTAIIQCQVRGGARGKKIPIIITVTPSTNLHLDKNTKNTHTFDSNETNNA